MKSMEDKEIIKEIVLNELKTHPVRNKVMVIAVALTTLLISSILTAGFSFLSSMQNYVEATPGPSSDGAILGTRQAYENVSEREEVDWADFVRQCSTASLHNSEFAGLQVELLAPENSYYEHNQILLKEGTLPENENQLLLSDTLASRLNIERPGEFLTLNVMLYANGEVEEASIPMEVCGIYGNPLKALSDSYEEIYTNEKFIRSYNSEIPPNYNYIYIKLNNLNPFLLKSDVYDKLIEIKEAVNADSVLTKNYVNFIYSLMMILPLSCFVILVMLSGFFFIYNVFSISLVSDIKWFGMMKTIGAASSQLKKIYKEQIFLLAVAGIITGSIIGYFFGLVLSPIVLKMTDYSVFYRKPPVFMVFLFTFLFSWITIRKSTDKLIRKVSSLSPIQAAHYEPHRKRMGLAVISFTLSGIIILIVCNISFGYDVEVMVNRYNQEECRIYHSAAMWNLTEPYEHISPWLEAQIEKLPFVENVDVIYEVKTGPDLIKNSTRIEYEGFLAEVKADGKLKNEAESLRISGNLSERDMHFTEGENIKLRICGIPSGRLEKEKNYLKVLEGSINMEKFSTGDYIIYQSIDYLGNTVRNLDESDRVCAGDKLLMAYYDDEFGDYYEKDMTVMAVVKKNDPYGTGDLGYSNVIIPDKLFEKIYGNYQERIAYLLISTSKGLGEQEYNQLNTLLQSENNLQVKIESKYMTRITFENQKVSIFIIGFFIAFLLSAIGISNMINTIVTDTLSSQKEIVTLQSIGMTKRQLKKRLFIHNFKIVIVSFLFILVLGGYMTLIVASSSGFTGFNLNNFIFTALIIFICITILSWLLAIIMTNRLTKFTIVSRLREYEKV